MPQARPLLFGAVLLALAMPGHPLAHLSGLPLSVPSLCLVLLVAGWMVALPGVPTRAGLWSGALALLAALKLATFWLAPTYGLTGEYLTDGKPGTVRVDRVLALHGDEFPVHFFNDVRRFNYYTPADPKRDLLPFTVSWTGQIVVSAGGPQTLTLQSNGLASVQIDNGPPASIAESGRVREASLTFDVPPGLYPIVVSYSRPDEMMPWLALDTPSALVTMGTSAEAVARDTWLRQVGTLLDAALVGLVALGFLAHLRVRGLVSPSPTPRAGWGARFASGPGREVFPARLLLAAYLVLAGGWELLGHLHLYGRAVLLSGGNDWLAYEGFARDLLTNGPLLTEARPLGQGLPFYYQPLYIYWVAFSHLILGESLFAPLFMNAVLGVCAGLGLFALTRELFGRGAAVVALLLFEAYRQTVFEPTAGLLLSENLIFPILPIFLLLLVRLARSGRWRAAVGAGFVLGLGGLARTTPLAILPPAVLVLLLAWRRFDLSRVGPRWLAYGGSLCPLGWRRTAGLLAVFVAVVILTLGLATTRNYVVSGRFVPITSSAGANLWEAHRPSAKVDLSRVDKDPLYERLGLDRTTREVVEFIRQDPVGYVGTLVPMFLYAVGVVGAVSGSWQIHPGLFGLWVGYLLVTLLLPRARALPTWFVHAFIWSHLAQMTVFFSHQYGFRLILPMYVAMVPIAAVGIWTVAERLGRLMRPLGVRLPSGAPLPPAARASLVLVAVVGGSASLGAGEWRGHDAAREAFYGLNGDVAIATRQASRPELLMRADAVYFVGDDSRSTDVAYLTGLAYPTLRWFDGARGFVLPPQGQDALYVAPDRAAADFAVRCLGDGALLGRERDAVTGAALNLYLAGAGVGECAAPRQTLGASFGEGQTENAKLLGLDGPASIEPGRTMDVLIYWEAVSRPRNRARPFVRLVDSQGRRWGQAETAVYPSAAWRPGERAVGVARLEVDPTLPPGEYRLDGGFTVASGQARTVEDGPWGSAGLPQARGATVRLVSRSMPLSPDVLPLDRRLDAQADGARLVGVDFDRDAARAGERLRLSLFWESTSPRPEPREVSLVLRQPGGAVLTEWRSVPVDGAYPTTDWKRGEIVRDTWDLTLPASLGAGAFELAAALVVPGQAATGPIGLGHITVQAADRELKEPELRMRVDAAFVGGAQLLGYDLKARRVRPGDNLDLTLVWRAAQPSLRDQVLALALLDESGRILSQWESEPAGGKRPTSGWTTDEFIEDGWKVRLPRELPKGKVRLAVSTIDPVANQRILTTAGGVWVDLPLEVTPE
ncbi:MAG: glycosyltransferase family 39 protein [Chloroflexi bacterium]|nr:glycosyltransferase family 39 protein [Chloroflexota bacterium]